MDVDPERDAMAEALMAAAERVQAVGSDEMQAVMRVMLFLLAAEEAKHIKKDSKEAYQS